MDILNIHGSFMFLKINCGGSRRVCSDVVFYYTICRPLTVQPLPVEKISPHIF